MSERRRSNRFVIPDTSSGTFRMMHDVYVEQISQELFAVVGDGPVSRDEDLLLELPSLHGERTIVSVQVVDNHTVMVGDAHRHRTVLRVVQPHERPAADRPVRMPS